jgi:type IV fimbrial biogenesis protein FimT
MLIRPARMHGFSLIEIMVAVVVMGIALAIAVPSYQTWINNVRVRQLAELMMTGLQKARSEAIKSGATVRFSMVDSLDGGCSTDSTGTNWVISLRDPDGQCDEAPFTDITTVAAADAGIIAKEQGGASLKNLELESDNNLDCVAFNSMGMARSCTNLLNNVTFQLAVRGESGSSCEDGTGSGEVRCLQVNVGVGGNVRMCDPVLNMANNPMGC